VVRERAADLGLATGHAQSRAQVQAQVRVQVRLEEFGAMVQAAFERQQRQGDDDLERAARAIGLSPEQTERARAIFGELALKDLRRESKAWDRLRAFSDLMVELTPDQRRRLWRYIRRESD